MGRVRGRVFPDVTFGAEIEGCGWVDHAWMEAGLPTCHWNGAPAGLATRRQLRELGLSPGGHGPVAALRRRPGGYLHALDQHTATGRPPVHPEHAETRYALTAAGHAVLTPASDPPPPGVVVLCCTDCDHVYEPTAQDFDTGRAGCPDPDCGGWTFSSALTEPATGGAR